MLGTGLSIEHSIGFSEFRIDIICSLQYVVGPKLITVHLESSLVLNLQFTIQRAVPIRGVMSDGLVELEREDLRPWRLF